MVDHRIFHPVVNHYRWFVETLAHIANIYLCFSKKLFTSIVYHIFWKMSSVFILRDAHCKL